MTSIKFQDKNLKQGVGKAAERKQRQIEQLSPYSGNILPTVSRLSGNMQTFYLGKELFSYIVEDDLIYYS